MEFKIRESSASECVQFAGSGWESHFDNCDTFFAATCSGEVVGIVTCATVGFDGKTIPMLDVVEVRKECQGKGIGVRLAVHALEHLIQLGIKKIDYDVAGIAGHKLLKGILKAKPEFREYLVFEDIFEND